MVETETQKETRKLSRKFRWAYCEFLKDVGMMIKVPQLTIATAVVFCHRFYAVRRHEAQQSDLHIIATACMFLAGKVEETPKSLSDLLKVSLTVRHRGEDAVKLLTADANFVQEQRELVLRAERLLLHTLAFDFNIEHPYKYLLSTVKEMQILGYISENCTRELAQIAWNFANDSLRTTVCLQHSAKDCAYAVIYLATKFMGVKIQLPKDWCIALEMDESTSEKISNEILDLYEKTDTLVNSDILESANHRV